MQSKGLCAQTGLKGLFFVKLYSFILSYELSWKPSLFSFTAFLFEFQIFQELKNHLIYSQATFTKCTHISQNVQIKRPALG